MAANPYYEPLGVQFAPVSPNLTPALAQMQPLRFGQGIQIQPLAAWSVPEAKPYIAQGVEKAMEAIGSGIKARRQQERDDRKTALAEKQQSLNEEKLKEEKRRHDQMHKETLARIDAVSSGKAKQQQEIDDVLGDSEEPAIESQPSAIDAPIPATSSISPPTARQTSALQEMPSASSVARNDRMLTLNGASTGGPFLSLSVAPVKLTGSSAATPSLAPATSIQMSPEEQAAAAKEEVQILKGLSGMPLPERKAPDEKPKKEELPSLGTAAGEKDTSLVDAVKNPSAFVGLSGKPALDKSEPSGKGALSQAAGIPPATKGAQEVDKRDMRYRFGDRPDLANRQALEFNKKYPLAQVEAEVKEPSKSVPYWHVDYKNVADKRREEARKIEEHTAAQGLKQQRLDLSREAKLSSMAKTYENHPTAKLMDTRKDAMQRMLVAIQEDREARKTNDSSLPLIHQEMMDLFAQFASGKPPTEAQFREVNHAFAGFSNWQAFKKKYENWKTGAKLDERDVRTMQDLMLNTYNTSANQANSQLKTIEGILKSEHPNISPMKLPVKYPLLKTREFYKEQLDGKDPDQAVDEYAKLRGEYFDEATGGFKKEMPQEKRELFLKLKPVAEGYIALKGNNFIPTNLDELRHPKKEVFGNTEYFKIPGFHSSYFSAPASPLQITETPY